MVRNYKRLPIKVKEEIIEQVKKGEKVNLLAERYAISPSLIYYWLKDEVKKEAGVSWLKYKKLKKENEELKRIIGLITLKLERGKKNRDY